MSRGVAHPETTLAASWRHTVSAPGVIRAWSNSTVRAVRSICALKARGSACLAPEGPRTTPVKAKVSPAPYRAARATSSSNLWLSPGPRQKAERSRSWTDVDADTSAMWAGTWAGPKATGMGFLHIDKGLTRANARRDCCHACPIAYQTKATASRRQFIAGDI